MTHLDEYREELRHRLNLVCKRLFNGDSQLMANKIHVNYRVVSEVLRGDRDDIDRVVDGVLDHTNVREQWLIDWEGSMR